MAAPGFTAGTTQAGTSGSSVGQILPAHSSGDLLLVFALNDTTATHAASGWTEVTTVSNVVRLTCFGKIAASSGETCTVTGAAQDFIHWNCKVTSHGLSTIADITGMVATATGTSTSGDPPNLDLGYSADVLWIANMGMDSSFTAPTANPSGYTNRGNGWSDGSTSAVAYGWATKTGVPDQAEDPGAWTLSGSEEWVTITIGIPNTITVSSRPRPMVRSNVALMRASVM